MYSPFYTTELKRTYPNRKYFAHPTVEEVKEHFNSLISSGRVERIELFTNTINYIKLNFVTNVSTELILQVLKTLKK